LFYKQDSLEIYGGIVATVVLTMGAKRKMMWPPRRRPISLIYPAKTAKGLSVLQRPAFIDELQVILSEWVVGFGIPKADWSLSLRQHGQWWGARFNPEAGDLDVIVVLDWDRVPPGAPDLPEKNSRKIKWVPMAIAAHEVANRALGGGTRW